MRILFGLGQQHIRHFGGVVRQLAIRGHTVRMAMPGQPTKWQGTDRLLRLPPDVANRGLVSEVAAPVSRGDSWHAAAPVVRSLKDYARYLHPRYAESLKLRNRALRKLMALVSNDTTTHLKAKCPQCRGWIRDEDWTSVLRRLVPREHANLVALAGLIEDSIPSDPTIERFIESEAPDLVLVTPLVKIGSYQPDYVKSARALGIPVALPVFSWDNLTNKGVMHVRPDEVFVWNEIQQREAVELHGMPAERVVVTGAPRFDEYLALTASPRPQFCAELRFEPDLPVITYLCSSNFVAPREIEFVQAWVEQLRQADDPGLRECQLLIRPHPKQQAQWKGFAFTDDSRTAVGTSEFGDEQGLYDCLHHSAAVVALNTTAALEAGALGTPVYTLLADQFRSGQEGTLHFHYLLRRNGGFIEVAPTIEEHHAHLSAALSGRFDREEVRRFSLNFVRPGGNGPGAITRLVTAIEDLGRRQRASAWRRLRAKVCRIRRVMPTSSRHEEKRSKINL